MGDFVFDAVCLFGAISSIALLVYGGWLVLVFQWNASIANQQTVRSLALHDSTPREALLEAVKAAALVYGEPPQAVRNDMRKAA
jgi:hypothetical protein